MPVALFSGPQTRGTARPDRKDSCPGTWGLQRVSISGSAGRFRLYPSEYAMPSLRRNALSPCVSDVLWDLGKPLMRRCNSPANSPKGL